MDEDALQESKAKSFSVGDVFAFIVGLVVICGGSGGVGYVAGRLAGVEVGRNQERREAADYGFGAFAFSKRTGEIDFHYGIESRHVPEGWRVLSRPD